MLPVKNKAAIKDEMFPLLEEFLLSHSRVTISNLRLVVTHGHDAFKFLTNKPKYCSIKGY